MNLWDVGRRKHHEAGKGTFSPKPASSQLFHLYLDPVGSGNSFLSKTVILLNIFILVCPFPLRAKTLFFFKDFIYLLIRETERQRHRQRENQAPHRDPNVGLDPRTPGSHLEPKAKCSTAEPPRRP